MKVPIQIVGAAALLTFGLQGEAFARGFGAVRGGVTVGPGGIRVGTINHVTNYISPVNLRTQAAYIRGGYSYPYFNANWYRAHSAAWVAPRWRVANYWAAPAWTSLAT